MLSPLIQVDHSIFLNQRLVGSCGGFSQRSLCGDLVVITSRAKAAITLGVGEKEIFGEVVRGAYVAPTP